MGTPRLFRREPDVVRVPHVHAFVHTRLQVGVDRATVEDDLATAIAAGDVADDEPGIAGFCAASFDLAASVFPCTRRTPPPHRPTAARNRTHAAGEPIAAPDPL